MANNLPEPVIAAIVLNYNSADDTIACSEQLLKQVDVYLTLIVVDNASETESLQKIEAWLKFLQPDVVIGTEVEVLAAMATVGTQYHRAAEIYLVKSHQNKGYSAGNNIGIRLAESLQVDAVLVSNPDVKYSSHDALSILYSNLTSDKAIGLAGPMVYDPEGIVQSPMFEPTFAQEVMFPFAKCWARRQIKAYLEKSTASGLPHQVHKLHGCCFMAGLDIYQKIDYLDENVFLYCEEAILAHKIHRLGKRVMLVPSVKVHHLHASGCGNFKAYCRSRRYYLSAYKNFGTFRLAAISLIQHLIGIKRRFASRELR